VPTQIAKHPEGNVLDMAAIIKDELHDNDHVVVTPSLSGMIRPAPPPEPERLLMCACFWLQAMVRKSKTRKSNRSAHPFHRCSARSFLRRKGEPVHP
jgi:hypothetical protein